MAGAEAARTAGAKVDGPGSSSQTSLNERPVQGGEPRTTIRKDHKVHKDGRYDRPADLEEVIKSSTSGSSFRPQERMTCLPLRCL
jgi:hypothetical protein